MLHSPLRSVFTSINANGEECQQQSNASLRKFQISAAYPLEKRAESVYLMSGGTTFIRRKSFMKKYLSEFKSFVMRGNVLNLAVGVIIGAAFQSVVTSLTDDIISPIIGLFTRRNFDALTVSFLGITLRYGAFLMSVVNFLIMAFVVFFLVQLMNRVTTLAKPSKNAPAPAPTTKSCPYCRTSIDINATRCPACTSEL
jgi:large conductance mechanosensitive channel